MSLATLFTFPRTAADIEQFMLANEAEHIGVGDAVFASKNVQIDRFILRPFFPTDFQGWLVRHSVMHTQTNDVLQLASNDLLVLDIKNLDASRDWFFLHADEHRQWRATLGI